MFKNREIRVQLHNTKNNETVAQNTNPSIPREAIIEMVGAQVKAAGKLLIGIIVVAKVVDTACNIAENRATRESN